jgi:hypothetical protein
MSDPLDELIAGVRARAAAERAAGPPRFDPEAHGLPGLEIRRLELIGLSEPASPTRPPSRPPCDDAAVDATEAALGFHLPPLLRRLYTEIGDGGFGPGEGIVGVGALVDLHQSYAHDLAVEQELGEWPRGLVPLCELDETLIACVDCTDPVGPIVDFDLYDVDIDEGEGFDEAFAPRAPSLEVWLREWLVG